MDTRLQKLILIFLIVFGSFTAMKVVKADDCITDGLTVCFDAHKNAFKVEAHAHLSILVPNDEYGQAVVAYWDWYHPDLKGIVTYEVVSETSGTQDVLYLTQIQAGALHDRLYPLDPILTKNIDLEKVTALNADHLTFIPMMGEGFVFVTNKTRLELAGISVDDKNNDGLIDAVDSFEKIMALKAIWETTDVEVLPLPLNEPLSFYPFLTAGGFSLFGSYDALKPGFDSEAFKTGLDLIAKLSEIRWNHSETNTSDTYGWKLDDVLVNDDFIFTVAGSWMDLGAFDAKAASEWTISKFPTYQGQEASPMVLTSGFAINAETYYPSAAHELIRILKSIKGFQLLSDQVKGVPLANAEVLSYLSFEDLHRSDLAKAFWSSVGEPVIAFPSNPSHLAMEMVYDMDMMGIIQALWDHSITLEEAQAQLVAESQRVIGELNAKEETPNDQK